MFNYYCICRPKLTCRKKLIYGSVIGLLISLSISAVSIADTGELQATGKSEITFLFEDNSYNAMLFTPQVKNREVPYPLIVVASGVGDKLSRFIHATGFSKMASRNSVIVAYVQIDQYEDWFNWIGSSSGRSNKGAEFFRSVITRVSKEANVLSEKTYLAGYSTGGILVLAAMCDMADEVAAFAAVSASLPDAWKAKCAIKRSVPALVIASRDDPIVPWNGGNLSIPLTEKKSINVLSVSNSIELWRVNNKCDARPVLEAFANVDPTDRTTVTRLKYDYGCNNDSPVILYAITGGGHAWPGSIVKLHSFEGPVSQDISATNVIWEFVRKYSLKH